MIFLLVKYKYFKFENEVSLVAEQFHVCDPYSVHTDLLLKHVRFFGGPSSTTQLLYLLICLLQFFFIPSLIQKNYSFSFIIKYKNCFRLNTDLGVNYLG